MKKRIKVFLLILIFLLTTNQTLLSMANEVATPVENIAPSIISAPTINGTITTATTKITGSYNVEGAKIQLKLGSKVLKTATVSNGKFIITIPKQKPGIKLEFIALVQGVLSSTNIKSYIVKLEYPVYGQVNSNSKYVSGRAYKNSNVTAIVNGKNYGKATATDGKFKITLKDKPTLGKTFAVRANYGNYSAKTSIYITSGLAMVNDLSGKMHRLVPYKDIMPMAKVVRELFNFNKNKGIKSIAVMTPPSIIQGKTQLPGGIKDYANELNTTFLNKIDDYGYDTLDLRKPFAENGLYNNELYFKYDHHWRIESSFRAATYVTDKLNQLYNFKLDPKKVYSNYDNYTKVVYEKYFLGSFTYNNVENTGYEDFTKMYPNFTTSYTLKLYNDSKKVTASAKGDFKTALIDSRKIHKGSSSYASYLRNYSKQVEVVNNKSDNNINALVISTSVGRPFSAFISTYFKKTAFIDLQSDHKFNRSVYDYIKEFKPKVVILLYTAPTFEKTRVWQFDMK